MYNHCSSCHHEGGIGPFSIMSYDDAVANAYTIQSYVDARLMPPWPPDPNCSESLINDRRLSQEDIDAIDNWIIGGMPSGDLASAPAPPIFYSTSLLPQVDQTVELPNYTVQQTGDEYRSFVIHSGYSSTHYLNQMEVIPGNNAIVHHVLIYYDPTSTSYNLDQADPLPGFASSGTTAASLNAVLIGGWAPGTLPQILPANMAYSVPANADFVVEIHFAPGSQGQQDATKINLKFCDDPNPRLMYVNPVLYHFFPSLVNGPLSIPANQVKTFYEKSGTFLQSYSLYSVLPHMHLIGKTISVYMTSPAGDTTRLVCIPDWNFHWQLGYAFHKLVKFPAGYQLRAEATYDNTSNNPNNPNNPPVTVTWGESTLDEMMVVFFAYLDYQPGDEDIVIDENTAVDETSSNPSLPVSIYPNPAGDEVEIAAFLPEHNLNIRVLNQAGSTIKSFEMGSQPKGVYMTQLKIDDLPQGIYFLELNSGGVTAIKKLVKL